MSLPRRVTGWDLERQAIGSRELRWSPASVPPELRFSADRAIMMELAPLAAPATTPNEMPPTPELCEAAPEPQEPPVDRVSSRCPESLEVANNFTPGTRPVSDWSVKSFRSGWHRMGIGPQSVVPSRAE